MTEENQIIEKEMTYYDILEVSPRATLQEIHNQYLKAKNAYTHDNPAVYSLLPAQECDEMLDKIEEAYFILSSPRKRREYDIAHGITPSSSTFLETSTRSIDEMQKEREREQEEMHRSNIIRPDISKKVVENRFQLNYEMSEDMEHRIETTEDFTGEFLKEIREYKNMPLDRLSDLTKISKNYLRAIEDESWESLPATVYVRGFVFQYAKVLKLNQDLVCKAYMSRIKEFRG